MINELLMAERFDFKLSLLFLAASACLLAGCSGSKIVACNQMREEKTTQTLFHCSFAKSQWKQNEWILVQRPDWDHFGSWVQRDSHIENQTPSDATPEQLISKRASETYTSMVLNRKFNVPVTISSTMEFSDRMAPSIVIAAKLGKNKNGSSEYLQHYEVVLFDKGINLWRHEFKDGKSVWKKLSVLRFSLQPNVPYNLSVKISHTKNGKMLSAKVRGETIEYIDNSLPDEFYAGITGCEGINRFYDFSITRD